MKKFIVGIVTLWLSISFVKSQNFVIQQVQTRHEIGIDLGVGIHNLMYKASFGQVPFLSYDARGSINYSYYFNQFAGVGTGFCITNFYGQFWADKITDSYTANDGNEDFVFHYTIKEYTEKQSLTVLQIPLLFRAQTGGRRIKFYFAAGGKIGFPLSGKTTSGFESITAFGYFPSVDSNIYFSQNQGFGSYNDLSSKKNRKFKISYYVCAEIGAKWILSEKFALYTGFYFDYGLNNVITPSEAENLINYEHPYIDYHPNSVWNTSICEQKVKPLAVGLQFSLAFLTGNAALNMKEMRHARDISYLQRCLEERQEAEQERKNKEKAEQARAERERKAQEEMAEKQRQIAEAQAQLKKAIDAENIRILESPISGDYTVGSSALTEAGRLALDEKAQILLDNPEFSIEVIGHTCNIGTDISNMRIGTMRAEVARQYLLSKGVPSERITVTTLRDTQPLVANDTEENRKKNRRVEIKVIKKE
ncbi:MAG: OmpA family protein [Bacteroidales bacterium]|jgi:outer membrane protein OmpA-like peptidoglycan-associated protein|nr:OmpA family protein [Bacteroidales bacterium]